MPSSFQLCVNFLFDVVGGKQFDFLDLGLVTVFLLKVQVFLENRSHFLHRNFL